MMPFSEFLYTVVFRPYLIKKLANKAILATLPDTVRVGPAVICLNPQDPVVSGALSLALYERPELKLASQIFREGMTIVDVGANIGLYTALAMHYLKGRGRILAFEPHPESCQFLTHTVELNAARLAENERPRVDILDFAASASEGNAQLFTNPTNKGDNRLYFFSSARDSEALPVRVTTIDSVLHDFKIANIDFLKLDVQGHEFEVIQGAQATLHASPNVIILSEFWPDGIRQSCDRDGMEYLSFLADLNFMIYQVHGNKLRPIRGNNDFESIVSRLKGRKYTSLLCTKNLQLETTIPYSIKF